MRLEPLMLIRAWKECAGPALLKQTRFLGVHFSNGVWVLKLEVSDPIWRQELEFQSQLILQAFHQKLREAHFSAAKFPQKVEILGGNLAQKTRGRLPRK